MVKKKQSKKSNKVVLVTGGFDPIHSGHIAYFESARKLGDCLVVGMNSDSWLIRKKGKFFMPSSERTEIIRALKPVDHVILFDDWIAGLSFGQRSPWTDVAFAPFPGLWVFVVAFS